MFYVVFLGFKISILLLALAFVSIGTYLSPAVQNKVLPLIPASNKSMVKQCAFALGALFFSAATTWIFAVLLVVGIYFFKNRGDFEASVSSVKGRFR